MAIAMLSKKWLAAMILATFVAGGASASLFAITAWATDQSVDVQIQCNGEWSGTLNWTLDGDNVDPAVDLDCSNNPNFRLNIVVPTQGATGSHANELRIEVSSPGTFGVTGAVVSSDAACVFNRTFDPENLGTIKSSYNCGNDGGGGDKLSNKIRIR
ncbi:MAG: hypothetical protein IH873_03460 [Chloroflexi bacterium]|nr:hypothetical protein [Chloroflexota bacterium]